MENKKNILILDDTKPIRILLLKKLEKRFNCFLAEDAKSALNIIKENPNIDLIISDYELPDLSGYEFLKRVKTIHPVIPVIMLSGSLNKTRLKALVALGVKKFLAKPVKINLLLEFINKIFPEKNED